MDSGVYMVDEKIEIKKRETRGCKSKDTIKLEQQEKKHVKYMFIYRNDTIKGGCAFSILTDKFEYYEHDMYCDLNVELLNPYVCSKLNNFFKQFIFDIDTNITYSDSFSRKSPIFMYFNILQQYCNFRLRSTNLNKIVRKIAMYHHTYVKNKKNKRIKKFTDITKYSMNVIWNKLIENDRCPWINQEINVRMKMMSRHLAKRTMCLRLAIYYMIIKDYYLVLKSKLENRKTAD